jgi:RHS repeat-associated protein
MRLLLSLFLSFCVLSGFANEPPEDNVILSTPEQIATLHTESSYFIGGLISPLSGQLALRETDLVVKGAQSLYLSHLYIPPYIPSSFPQYKTRQEEWNNFYLAQHLLKSYKGWTYLPHLRLEYFSGSKQVHVSDPMGVTLDFRLSSQSELVSKPYAIHNLSGEMPSGKNDPRNTRITYDKTAGNIKVFAPDGATRIYGNRHTTSSGRIIFFLLKETLPNGKVIRYEYDQKKLVSIESKDPHERFTYAKIHVDSDLNLNGGTITFKTSSGIQAQYSHARRSLRAILKVNPFTGASVNRFEWNPLLPSLLTGVSSPFYRKKAISYDHNFLLTGYSGKEDVFTCSYGSYGRKNKHFKIQTLSFPVGPNDTFQPVYTLSYDSPVPGKCPGYTIVTNPNGTFTRYDFSEKLLMTSIQWLDEKRIVKKQKIFTWTDKHYLAAIEIKDGKGFILHKKTFEYDHFGNPKVEILHGNLTGNGQYESYAITREFSQDGKNLLLKETTEEDKTTTWDYLPGTNLITTKFIKKRNKIILREFYEYDDCNNLVKAIHDDGSGKDLSDLSDVSQRMIKEYRLRQQVPYFHMPEWIEERYWDQGEEKLLKRMHYIYDAQGNVKEEQVYGSDGQYVYTIHRTYNERGDVLSETNALGDTVSYSYSDRGELTYKNSFSERLHTTFTYDRQGRLKRKEEKGEEIKHLYAYDYDRLDRLVANTDIFGSRTSYTYDPITGKVIETTFPCIESFESLATPVKTQATYDVLGNCLMQTDANGNVTQYTYNSYGSPIHVLHPDGGEERYIYTKGGQLAAYADPDGLTIRYKRDVLGRVLSKKYINTEDEEVAEETFAYSGYNLINETDKEEYLKQYFYDGAGRKVREEFCGKIVHFNYDRLGFLERVVQENGDNTLVTTYTRDFLGQVLKEEKSDLLGNVFYQKACSYDADGNQKTLLRFIDDKEAQESFDYDPIGRMTKHTDALGYETIKTYKQDATNALGQRILQIAETDPLKVTKVKTYDAFGRVAKSETVGSNEQLLSRHQNIYDPNGNLAYRIDNIYQGSERSGTQIIRQTYNVREQLASTTRGYGTSDPRETNYTYTPAGKLQSKTPPNQISLFYDYDDLGFLSSISSSDGEIDHTFEYDREGRLLYAADERLRLAIEREVDPYGNVIKETFPNSLAIEKKYDNLDRPTSVTIQDVGVIDYGYDPLYLKSVKRCNPEGSALYAHKYISYDQSGHLLAEKLIHGIGTVHHKWDIKERNTSITSPYSQETASYDPCNNLQKKNTNGRVYEYSYDELYQLTLEKGTDTYTSHDYDSVQNIIKKNHQDSDINHLNELLSNGVIECEYDLNGNQITKKTPHETLEFIYDPLNRLIGVLGEEFEISFAYDPLCRRLSKKTLKKGSFGSSESIEHYLYDDDEEIGTVTGRGKLKNLKVLGASTHKKTSLPVAIELNGQVFAPILDIQGNISKLVDSSKNVCATYQYSAFGEERKSSTVEEVNPWRYFSKRLDPETQLIYFGKRYYDPQFARWITPDPAGFLNSVNLYQYSLNNPFRYYDPNGEFVFIIPLVPIIMGTATIAEVLTGAAAIAVASWATYEGAKALETWITRSNTKEKSDNLPDLQTTMQRKKKGEVDEKLSDDPLNDPNLEDISHPEGKKEGRYKFRDKQTGEIIEYDQAQTEKPGHKAHDHYHRPNPNATGKENYYLDSNGNPVPKGSESSHLYPPDWVWWE